MNTQNITLEQDSNAPIFIVGLPRSGSTLWSNVFAQHPSIALFTDMHFLKPWHKDFRYLLRKTGDLQNDENVHRLIEKMFSDSLAAGLRRAPYFWKSIRDLRNDGLADALRQRILNSPDRSIGFIFRALIEEATRCRGKKRAVVKFPVYPVYVERLSEWWPDSRIVHITRDPRSIAASKSNDPGGTAKLKDRYPLLSPIFPQLGMAYATFQYTLASRAHAKMDGRPNYRLFQYEDLMDDPETIIRDLCKFCLLDYEESMLHPKAGQASSVTGQKSGGFDPLRIHAWQKKLAPWQSKTITYLTRPSMRRFNYKPD